MHLVFRRKLFWVLFALALLSFLFMFGAIYLLATLRQQYPVSYTHLTLPTICSV